MNKQEFLSELRKGLTGLPPEDIEERSLFYSEMIDDITEEGKTEEEAVESIGPVSDIVSQTVSDVPLSKIVKERIKPKRTIRAWEIILLILGFPIWFPVAVACFVLLFAFYLVLWILVLVLWILDLSFWLASIACIVLCIIYYVKGYIAAGIALTGASLFLAGISILLLFGCIKATKGTALLCKNIGKGIKSLFLRKEKTV